MGIKERLQRNVQDYQLSREAGVIEVMRELERISPAEILRGLPEKRKRKIQGVHLGTDLFYHRTAEIVYMERMHRGEKIRDYGYQILDALVN